MTIKKKAFEKGIRIKPTTDNTSLRGDISVSSVDNKLKATLDSYADYTAIIHNVGDKVRHTDKLNYVCIQITTGAEDPSNAAFWTVTERSIVTEDQTQTLTYKTMDATDATGTNTVSLDASDATYDDALNTVLEYDLGNTVQEALDTVKDKLDAQNEAVEIEYDPADNPIISPILPAVGNIKDALDETGKAVNDHIIDTEDAHLATAIGHNPAGSSLTTATMQAAADEIAGRLDITEGATGDNAQDLTDHEDEGVGAHGASSISYDSTTSLLAADELQEAVDELVVGGALHLADPTDAHNASAISVSGPTGNLAATDVQTALDELQTDIDTRALKTELTIHRIDTTTHGTTSDIVGKDDVQTLTNKTIESQTMLGDTTNVGTLKTNISPNTDTGVDADMSSYTSSIVRLENSGLVSLATITSPDQGKEITIINSTGDAVVIKNDVGATAANRILTGTKEDITLKDESSITVKYDNAEARWMIVGGVAGEGAGDTDVDVMFVDNFDGTSFGEYIINEGASLTDAALEVINGKSSLKLEHNDLSQIALSGTMDPDIGGTLVFGFSGTLFETELVVGDLIEVGPGLSAQIREVASISSQSSLNVTVPWGPQVGGLTDTEPERLARAVTAERVIPVPNKFRNKSVKMGFDINSNATSGGVRVTVVDATNEVTIVDDESIEPFNATGSEKRTVEFIIPETCASLSYEFSGVPEAFALTFIDDIQIETDLSPKVGNITVNNGAIFPSENFLHFMANTSSYKPRSMFAVSEELSGFVTLDGQQRVELNTGKYKIDVPVGAYRDCGQVDFKITHWPSNTIYREFNGVSIGFNPNASMNCSTVSLTIEVEYPQKFQFQTKSSDSINGQEIIGRITITKYE